MWPPYESRPIKFGGMILICSPFGCDVGTSGTKYGNLCGRDHSACLKWLSSTSGEVSRISEQEKDEETWG